MARPTNSGLSELLRSKTPAASTASVRTSPGYSDTTVIPCGFSSCAVSAVSLSVAAVDSPKASLFVRDTLKNARAARVITVIANGAMHAGVEWCVRNAAAGGIDDSPRLRQCRGDATSDATSHATARAGHQRYYAIECRQVGHIAEGLLSGLMCDQWLWMIFHAPSMRR